MAQNQYKEFGDRKNPTLVCVPGLLGGPENFVAMVPPFMEQYHIIIFDPNVQKEPVAGMSAEDLHHMRELSYNSTSADIAEALDEVGKEEAYLFGLSLGGKVVYDFAIRYPERVAGCIITDVGPGPFNKTDLYVFVETMVNDIQLTMPWPELKKIMAEMIPERNLRSMIQSQIHYPGGQPPGVWKTGMQSFPELLSRQKIDDQFEGLESVDEKLYREGRIIHVMQAEHLSGINADSLDRLKALKSIRLYPLMETTHFLHITHKDHILDYVAKLPGYYREAKEKLGLATV